MKVVKVKYRGEWRNVIGKGIDGNGHLCLKVQSIDKTYYNLIPPDDKWIEDKVERPIKHYPSAKKRFKELTQEEKERLEIRFHSGAWTLKEICDMFNVTRLTVKKVVGVL